MVTDQTSEFKGRVPLLAVSTICFSTGMGATMFYSLGAFMPSLQAEFGWGRDQISLGATMMSIGSILFGIAAGRLSDRFGAHRVAATSFLLYGLAIILMILFMRDIWGFWAFFFLISIVGQGSTQVVLVRPVIASFARSRGMALGIAATGAGLGGFWVPWMVSDVTAVAGWRAAYVAIAIIAIAIAPLAWFRLREVQQTGEAVDGSPLPDGMTGAQAIRTGAFWLMTMVSLTMATAIAGVVIHLVSFLRDVRIDALSAARIASLIGIASIVGRLGMGALLDRFDTALISTGVFVMAICGILLLRGSGADYAFPGVIMLGVAVGAETDMLAFMTARLFGRSHYGTLFGWIFAVFTVGYGISPLLVGWLRDRSGSYVLPFDVSIGLMVLAVALVLALGPALRHAIRTD